jgi:hypothetical protein
MKQRRHAEFGGRSRKPPLHYQLSRFRDCSKRILYIDGRLRNASWWQLNLLCDRYAGVRIGRRELRKFRADQFLAEALANRRGIMRVCRAHKAFVLLLDRRCCRSPRHAVRIELTATRSTLQPLQHVLHRRARPRLNRAIFSLLPHLQQPH